ncbi:MAG: hypothetical protein EOM19_05605 [Candidatus Moranbacteria bacterium]|nr:hypothetical protein [Candidatus Moranbacteria bacterium]
MKEYSTFSQDSSLMDSWYNKESDERARIQEERDRERRVFSAKINKSVPFEAYPFLTEKTYEEFGIQKDDIASKYILYQLESLGINSTEKFGIQKDDIADAYPGSPYNPFLFLEDIREDIRDFQLFDKVIDLVKQNRQLFPEISICDIETLYASAEKFGIQSIQYIDKAQEKFLEIQKKEEIKQYLSFPTNRVTILDFTLNAPFFQQIMDVDMQAIEFGVKVFQKMQEQGVYVNPMSIDIFIPIVSYAYAKKEELEKANWDFSTNNIPKTYTPLITILFLVHKESISNPSFSKNAFSSQYEREENKREEKNVKKMQLLYIQETFPWIREMQERSELTIADQRESLDWPYSDDWIREIGRKLRQAEIFSQDPEAEKIFLETFHTSSILSYLKKVDFVLERRKEETFYDRIASCKFLYKVIKEDEYRGIENIDLLSLGREVDPHFIQWLSVLYKKTGFDPLKELEGYGYAEAKVLSWRKWYENPKLFRRALADGFFDDGQNIQKDKEGGHNIYKYEEIKLLLENKELSAFLNAYKEFSLTGLFLNDSVAREALLVWLEHQEDFDILYKEGFQTPYQSEPKF